MNFKINDIPLQHRDIAEFLGIDIYINFCENFGGDNIYIPTKKTLVNNIRNKEIYKLYINGYSIKQLSKKYNLTNSSIRQIIKKPQSLSNI